MCAGAFEDEKREVAAPLPSHGHSWKGRRPLAFGLILEGFKSCVRAMRRLQCLRAAAVVVFGALLWWTMARRELLSCSSEACCVTSNVVFGSDELCWLAPQDATVITRSVSTREHVTITRPFPTEASISCSHSNRDARCAMVFFDFDAKHSI